jgi:hypothetical protein
MWKLREEIKTMKGWPNMFLFTVLELLLSSCG